MRIIKYTEKNLTDEIKISGKNRKCFYVVFCTKILIMQKIQKFEWIEWEGCKVSSGDESELYMIILSQGPETIIRMKTSDGIFFLKPLQDQTVRISTDLARYDKSIEFTS